MISIVKWLAITKDMSLGAGLAIWKLNAAVAIPHIQMASWALTGPPTKASFVSKALNALNTFDFLKLLLNRLRWLVSSMASLVIAKELDQDVTVDLK